MVREIFSIESLIDQRRSYAGRNKDLFETRLRFPFAELHLRARREKRRRIRGEEISSTYDRNVTTNGLLTFEIGHRKPVAVDSRSIDVRVEGPEGRRAHVIETLQEKERNAVKTAFARL